ncbi:uracil-DNA glycosylase family protein [Negadavirga shengliensis]|uniref:Uracil-DNA glycosylase family protein n=1 Tax=Negadavirga shengliensis TaxID=1389218 RepID=A0ABV9SYG0_9BACT
MLPVSDPFHHLIQEIRSCRLCEEHLPLGPNPVFSAASGSRILIIGQAPGAKVHASGIPWDDLSGEQLRSWLSVDRNTFYDTSVFGIVPMGFCYPGRGKGGDMPPRPECAPIWHGKLLTALPHVKLTLLIGQYAHAYYLKEKRRKNLTETVKHFKDYLPAYFPLVHPSPRNRIWQKRNPWFEAEVLPELRKRVGEVLSDSL